MINVNSLSNSYTITNTLTNTTYITGGGTYYGYGVNVVFDKSKYDKTDKTVSHRGITLPVYISKSGRAFVFAINKNGCEYKKYIK